jgi:hypothetical protein
MPGLEKSSVKDWNVSPQFALIFKGVVAAGSRLAESGVVAGPGIGEHGIRRQKAAWPHESRDNSGR